MNNMTDMDYEAMREGSAISRLKSYATKRDEKRDKKYGTGTRKKEEDVDVLRILNIIQGKSNADSPRPTNNP